MGPNFEVVANQCWNPGLEKFSPNQMHNDVVLGVLASMKPPQKNLLCQQDCITVRTWIL